MGGGGAAPTPPKFTPIPEGEALQAAEDANRRSFMLTDERYKDLYPGLVSGNEYNIQDSYKQLFQPMDSGTQNQIATRSIEQALDTTGGNDPMASIGKTGSASGASFGMNLANMFEAKQDYDRSAWQQAVGANPLRDIAPGGDAAAKLSIFNTQGQAGSAYQNYAAGVQTSNAKGAAKAATTQAAVGATAAIVGGIIAALI